MMDLCFGLSAWGKGSWEKMVSHSVRIKMYVTSVTSHFSPGVTAASVLFVLEQILLHYIYMCGVSMLASLISTLYS